MGQSEKSMASGSVNRKSRIKYAILTILAGTSFLLFVVIVALTVRSYWYTSSILFFEDQQVYEFKCYRGQFSFESWCDPRNGPCMMPCVLSTVPSSFYRRINTLKWDIAVAQGRLLGFGWGRGDPSRTIHKVAWIRWFVQIPSWFFVIILALLPVGWFRWRKSCACEDRRVVRRYLLVASTVPLTILIILGALLAINTKYLGPAETPLFGLTSHRAVPPEPEQSSVKLTVMSYNIWLGQAYKGFWRFRKAEDVAERMCRIAELIQRYEPDIVFLQEVSMESGPDSIDQTPLIAETAGMHAWAFGEAFNNGLPFYRMIGGNAILSRWPLQVVTNQTMAGRSPFYKFWVGNQRTLWCKTRIGGHEVLLACLHLASEREQLRPIQMQQILDFVGDQPAIIAGDFNSGPSSEVFDKIIETGRFQYQVGDIAVPDYIFVPSKWELIEYKVIESDLSDHLPVLATFRIPLIDKSDFTDKRVDSHKSALADDARSCGAVPQSRSPDFHCPCVAIQVLS